MEDVQKLKFPGSSIEDKSCSPCLFYLYLNLLEVIISI
jgi:hypothetical protein